MTKRHIEHPIPVGTHGPVDAREAGVAVVDDSTMADTTRSLIALSADTKLHAARRAIVGASTVRADKLRKKFMELTDQAARHHAALSDALEADAFESSGEAATAADEAEKMRRALESAAAAQENLDLPRYDTTKGQQLLTAAARLVAMLAKLVLALFRASTGLARNDLADGIHDARSEAARIQRASTAPAAPRQGAEASGAAPAPPSEPAGMKPARPRPARQQIRL